MTPEEQIPASTPVTLADLKPAQPTAVDDPFQRLQKKTTWSTAGGSLQSGQVKKGSRISPKFFLIGCGTFFLIFLGIVYAGLYYAVTSSEFLQTIGLAIDDVKNILIIFAVLFFGILFFVGFYVLVLNVYRLVTIKEWKAKFVVGTVLGFLILALTIVFGTLSITKIRALSGATKIQTTQLALPYVVTRDKPIWVNEGIPLIAPLKMKYQLNKDQFDRNILPALAGNQVSSFILDCGNGQTLEGNNQMHLSANSFFGEHCLYMTKGDYPVKLQVNYLNKASGEEQSKTFDLYTLTIPAAIGVSTLDDKPTLNDKKTEYILGVAPVTAQLRAQLLFTDLSLDKDTIIWDTDGDGAADVTNNASFDLPLTSSKLHTINYQLPGLPTKFKDTWLSFDLRVLESPLAKCDLKIEPIEWKKYSFKPQFDELVSVTKYTYLIYDTKQDVLVDKIDTNKEVLSYAFRDGGSYEISMMYFTPQAQKGSCDAKPLIVGFTGNQVSFDLKYKQDTSAPFVSISGSQAVIRDEANKTIKVTIIPAVLQFTITDIAPDPTAKVAVYFDGKQIFEERSKTYEVSLGTLGKKQLQFVVTTAQGKESTQEYTIDVSRKSVSAMIKVDPVVGEDPLDVVLDASISPLYDEEDEIVYFTRDFGDGKNLQNVSQGKVTHTYTFDQATQKGEYYPSVTIKTRKGFTDTYRVKEPIIVKRKQKELEISLDSHPTQQAKVGDTVQVSVQTDGIIKHIDRDFGNTKSTSCDDRSCASAAVTYDTPGDYVIRAEIEYDNDTPVTARVKIKVFE